MPSFSEFLTLDSIARSLLILSAVVTIGLVIGDIKAFGVRLGIAGVLFSGIIFGRLHWVINPDINAFVRDLGLILFVYTIGMQVGPAFFSSFKKNGLQLNLLAAGIVLLGTMIVLILSFAAHIPLAAAVGILSGAATNTPSLGAAQQALEHLPGISPEQIEMPALGYAVSYPFGIIGVILAMLFVRLAFRIDVIKEGEAGARLGPSISSVDMVVENPNLNGLTVDKISFLDEHGIVISRVMHGGKVKPGVANTPIYLGDIVRVVGPQEKLKEVTILIGKVSPTNIVEADKTIEARRVLVTKNAVVGRSLADLQVRSRYGVTITRIVRADIDFPAAYDVVLQMADIIVAVGTKEDIDRFAKDVGNAPKELEQPFIVPIFIGIALGVIVGSIPIYIPGVPFAVKLGLAGGPLLVAMALSWVGRVGKVIWYMSNAANNILREFGIVLFLACVGLRAGENFFEVLVHGSGFFWMGAGALVTFLPPTVVAVVGRKYFKLSYPSLCGLMAGSMTDPPALAFANGITQSGSPSVAYATVYPLVMLMRILIAQLIILFFLH